MRDEVLKALCELGTCVLIQFERGEITLEYIGNGKWDCNSILYSEMVWRHAPCFNCALISWNINAMFDGAEGVFGKMMRVLISRLCGGSVEYKL